MQQVRLFIFDLDGTLVDTLEDITASLNFALTKLGRPPLPLDTVRRCIGDGLGMLIARALDGHEELAADAAGIYTVHHSRNLVVRSRLYPGVRETLDRLHGAAQAVVTNKSREFTVPLLEQLGIGARFAAVVSADDGLPLKPDPAALLHILRTLGVAPGDAVMVGDSEADMRAGRAAGVATCAVTYGFRTADALRREGPDHMIGTFAELCELYSPAGAHQERP